MIIIGAKGFAKEVLEVLYQLGESEEIFFYDDISDDIPQFLFDQFKILRTSDEVVDIFHNVSKRFTIGTGNPFSRYTLYTKFRSLGGEFSSTISPLSQIGHFGNTIGSGVNIMTGTVIINDIRLGIGSLINLNCTIGHNTVIGQFVNLSPGVHISGRCTIGDFCNLGTGTVLLPEVTLGNNVVVGAGSVVTKNIEKNSLVVGVPGKVIRKINDLEDDAI
jgi:sugar O-acyltransferase (sialic acid O-acetyltransferase NeuD family)